MSLWFGWHCLGGTSGVLGGPCQSIGLLLALQETGVCPSSTLRGKVLLSPAQSRLQASRAQRGLGGGGRVQGLRPPKASLPQPLAQSLTTSVPLLPRGPDYELGHPGIAHGHPSTALRHVEGLGHV